MKKWTKIKKYIKNPLNIIIYITLKKQLKFISDEMYLKLMYYHRIGKKLDLDNPRTFNEKLQWLKINDRKSKYTKMVDKYEVRAYISKTIGDKYLIPLIGVYEKFEEIEFNKLPKKFVLKCTHDSGGLVICNDKEKMDFEKVKNKINKCLKKNYYYHGREWPYKNIEPKIICEEYIEDKKEKDLKDYKFMCFNGEVKTILVCSERGKNKQKMNMDFFDTEWENMKFERCGYNNSNHKISKPKNLYEMLELAKTLSKGKKFLRVDFYEVNGKIYFGELTFYPAAGFEKFNPERYDEILGEWLNIQDELF